MALPTQHLLDELATAYIQLMAALAGATIAVSRRDYGVDGTLKHIVESDGRFIETGFPVDFQLKGTTIASIQDRGVVYDLAVRNYDLLVERDLAATPYYLFLVCFGGDPSGWVLEDSDKLVTVAKAYWWKESGKKSDNSSSVRITIPLGQRLNLNSLKGIIESESDRFST